MTIPTTPPQRSEDPHGNSPELQSVDWRQLVTFTDGEAEDPNAPTYASELIPGELSQREYERERERAYNSDLTLDDQVSQFLASPWDEEPYEEYDLGREPVYGYVQLERLKRSDPERYQRYLDEQAVKLARHQKEIAGIEFRTLDL